MTPDPQAHSQTVRAERVRRFARARYGIRGSLALHRHALGRDLLRAPLNVALAPVALMIRLIAVLLRLVGLKNAAAFLSRQNIFLHSDLCRKLAQDITGFIKALDAEDVGVSAPSARIEHEVSRYCETRNAIAEIAISLLVLLAGFLLFQRATPGLISLTGSVAEIRAQQTAVDDFFLGNYLGRQWYGLFPVEISLTRLVLTGAGLAIAASFLTTFIGIVTDPIQVATGTHQRRLLRLLDRLDVPSEATDRIEREHIFARLGDLGDLLIGLWRALRG